MLLKKFKQNFREITVYRILKLAVLLFAVTSFTTGCMNLATANVNPTTDLSTLKTMYVKHYPSDNSGVNQEIADKLRSKGVTVTTGSGAAPSNVDALVTYVDRWMWDITMYMLELTITIRDPKTEAPLATGNSLHTSLTRKSQTAMVDEVVNNIYSAAPIATSTATQTPASKAALINPSSVAAPTPLSKGSTLTTNPNDLVQKLRALSDLKKNGVITEDEYTKKKKTAY